MAQRSRTYTLGEIAELVGGDLFGPPDLLIEGPAPAGSADPSAITFATDQKYLVLALSQPIGAILVPRGTAAQRVPTIHCDNPRAAFGQVLAAFDRTMEPAPGIHPTAVISGLAKLGTGVAIGPYVVIENDAIIGDNVMIGAGSFVGPRSQIGSKSVLFPRTTLYHDVLVGSRCRIHSGAVIGADGFGFANILGRNYKVPQVGRVVIGDDVEIGANTCIDRATCGDTVIEPDVKLDDLVMIGHNCRVGAHTVIASQSGISGSSTLGEGCVLGGQVGIADHTTLGDGVQLAGQSGVMQDTETGAYLGSPILPIKQALRVYALLKRLPELFSRLKAVEQTMEKKNDS